MYVRMYVVTTAYYFLSYHLGTYFRAVLVQTIIYPR